MNSQSPVQKTTSHSTHCTCLRIESWLTSTDSHSSNNHNKYLLYSQTDTFYGPVQCIFERDWPRIHRIYNCRSRIYFLWRSPAGAYIITLVNYCTYLSVRCKWILDSFSDTVNVLHQLLQHRTHENLSGISNTRSPSVSCLSGLRTSGIPWCGTLMCCANYRIWSRII